MRAKTIDEFLRYKAVVNDPDLPVKGLEVITNDPRAAEYFAELMRALDVPGRVVVSP